MSKKNGANGAEKNVTPAPVSSESEKELLLLDPSKVVIIGIDTKDGDEHPLWDAGAYGFPSQSFVDSIRREGQIQAIVVRKNGSKYEVVVGRQRVKALREINKDNKVEMVPVRATLSTHTDVKDIVSVVAAENAKRKDTGPMARAKLAERMKKFGASIEHIASVVGDSTTVTVRNLLSLLTLPIQVREAIEAGDIKPSIGYVLAKSKLTGDEILQWYQTLVKRLNSGEKISTGLLRAMILSGKDASAEDVFGTDAAEADAPEPEDGSAPEGATPSPDGTPPTDGSQAATSGASESGETPGKAAKSVVSERMSIVKKVLARAADENYSKSMAKINGAVLNSWKWLMGEGKSMMAVPGLTGVCNQIEEEERATEEKRAKAAEEREKKAKETAAARLAKAASAALGEFSPDKGETATGDAPAAATVVPEAAPATTEASPAA